VACHGARQLVRVLDTLVADRDDDIPGANARGLGRPASLDARNESAARLLQTDGFREIGRQRLERDPQPTSLHEALLSQLREHRLHGVDGDRAADTVRARANGGVHADHTTVDLEERPAAVARVDRGIGVDELIVRPEPERAKPLGAPGAPRWTVVTLASGTAGSNPKNRAHRSCQGSRSSWR
jgi:hypothetical protein